MPVITAVYISLMQTFSRLFILSLWYHVIGTQRSRLQYDAGGGTALLPKVGFWDFRIFDCAVKQLLLTIDWTVCVW